MEITLQETVDKMIESLEERAEHFEVHLNGINSKNFNTFLDDLFEDGGEVRCEYFTDLTFDYALQFGEFESNGFESARWQAIEMALNVLSVKYQ